MRPNPNELADWRQNLQWVGERIAIIEERTPAPQDGTDLLKTMRERAALASLFPETATVMQNAIRAGAALAAASGLIATQQRFRAGGSVLLTGPKGWRRLIPDGISEFYHPQWIDGFAFAATTGDQDALTILCTPDCIDACTGPQHFIDRFWPLLCGALASAVVEPPAVSGWADDAEALLAEAHCADPELVALCIRPLLPVVRAIAAVDGAATQATLSAAVAEHRAYYALEAQHNDPLGLIFPWILGLAAVARRAGLPVEIAGDDVPQALQQLDREPTPWHLTYCFPLSRIATPDEARWFIDLAGFASEGREHRIVELNGRTIARYEVSGGPGIPHARLDFVLDEDPNVPTALDAGELLELARFYAETAGEPKRAAEATSLLDDAAACVDAVLARIPDGQDQVPIEHLSSPASKGILENEPGRLRRERLLAYRTGLVRTGPLRIAEESPFQTGDTAVGVTAEDPDESDARATALAAIELIRVQVHPLLEAIGRDRSGEVLASLRPRDGDLERVFRTRVLESARAFYAEFWDKAPPLSGPVGPFEVRCTVAPAGMLVTENELSHAFPSGYRSIAGDLEPSRVWVAWKYVAPGEVAGLAFDGLVWVVDHWAWFPRPYRAIRQT